MTFQFILDSSAKGPSGLSDSAWTLLCIGENSYIQRELVSIILKPTLNEN